MLNFKGMRLPIDAILVCIHCYAAYPLSYRDIEEMMDERGVSVDHSAINRHQAVTSLMLNFNSFGSAAAVLNGVELMHMIRKGQFAIGTTDAMSFADQFYALAEMVRPA